MANSSDADIEIEATVGGSFPSIPTCATSGTSGIFYDLITVISGIQLRQGHRSGSRTLGTSTRQCASRRSGGYLGCLIVVTMTCCGDAHIEVEAAVGGSFPSVAPRACRTTGCCFYDLIVVIGGAQLRERYGNNIAAYGAITDKRSCRRGSWNFRYGVTIIVTIAFTSFLPYSIQCGIGIVYERSTRLKRSFCSTTVN